MGFAASGPNTRTQQLCLFLGVLALKKGVLKVRFIHCLTRGVPKNSIDTRGVKTMAIFVFFPQVGGFLFQDQTSIPCHRRTRIVN